MLDTVLARIFAPLTARFVAGGRAKGFELAAFVLGLAAMAVIAHHWVWTGLGVFVLARAFAGLLRAPGALGGIYEAVAFAGLPFAFALDVPERALAAVFLIFALTANAAVRLKFGRSAVGAVELTLLFILAAILPAWFGLIAYTGGVLCFIAAGIVASRHIDTV